MGMDSFVLPILILDVNWPQRLQNPRLTTNENSLGRNPYPPPPSLLLPAFCSPIQSSVTIYDYFCFMSGFKRSDVAT